MGLSLVPMVGTEGRNRDRVLSGVCSGRVGHAGRHGHYWFIYVATVYIYFCPVD